MLVFWPHVDYSVLSDVGDAPETEENLREALVKFIDVSDTAEPAEDADATEALASDTSGPLASTSKSSLNVSKSEDSSHEDAVFLKSYIPRNLNEVYDPERDAERVGRGEGEGLIYAGVTGIVEANRKEGKAKKGVKFIGEEDEDEDEEEDDGEEDEDEGESDEDEDESDDDGEGAKGGKKAPRGHRHEDREAKKVIPPLIPENHAPLTNDPHSL